MGRPRINIERPACPRGHVGTVYLHGQRVRDDGLYSRTRYRCVPDEESGAKRHTFTGPRRSPTHAHPDGIACSSCEHDVGRGEGPSIAHHYAFSVAEVARGLMLVGEGKSIRESSQIVRHDGGRYKTDHRGMRWASRQNALASDYLDHFGPTIVREMTPPQWPRILVLDSIPLGMKAHGAEDFGFDSSRRGGAVLVAAGRDRIQGRTRNWLTALAGDETADSWWEFLGQLDDDPPPFWVVADGAKAIRNAVEARWPQAHFYPCEYHLRENAMKHATDDGALEVPGLVTAIKRCFWGLEAWEDLGKVVLPLGASFLMQWYVRIDPEARRMMDLKHRFGDYPNGNGPAESVAVKVGARLGERTRNFRNADRLASVVALMGIDISEQANVARYARSLRERLERDGWDPDLDWEARHDLYGHYSSMADLMITAWEREAAARPGAMQDAVSASVQRKIAVVNLLHAAEGVAPLVASVAPGRSVASVSVAGMFLRDFPALMQEWDGERNVGIDDPGSIPAGRGIRPHWICDKGHHWQAWLSDRVKRATGCRRCNRQWADETNSIATQHPELVVEWDIDQNGKRGPDRTKETSKTPVTWKCATHPGEHPSYAMSPAARCRRYVLGKPGCMTCRAALTKRARKSPLRASRPALDTATEVVVASPLA